MNNWSSSGLGSTSTSLQLNGSTAAYSGVHGTSVTFNVGLSPTAATGSVGIVDTANETSGGTASGPQNNGQFTIPLSSGSGTATYNGLPGGTYTVSARYAGDASNAASTSSPISVTISPEPSTTLLQVNAYNPITGTAVTGSSAPYGSTLLMDAKIEGTAEGSSSQGLATGTVTFASSGATLGTAKIDSSNIASWPSRATAPAVPAAGAYSYTASYSGDASYNNSTSAGFPFTIVKAATTLAANNPPSRVFGIYGTGGSTSLAFTIQTPYNLGAAPTGSITITANGQTADSYALSPASPSGSGLSQIWLISAAGFVPDNLFQTGANSITFIYSGDANYASSSQTIIITDMDGIGSFSMTSSGDLSIVAGQQAQEQFSFTPSGGFYDFVYITLSGIPSGVNTGANGFGYFNGTQGTVQLPGSSVSGSISFATPFDLAPGTYPITATAKDPTGKVVQTVTFNLIVSGIPANAGISIANGGAVTFPEGATRLNTASIIVTPTNGFIGYLSVNCSVANGNSSVANPACNLTYPFVALTSSTPQTVSIPFTSSGAAPGTYSVTITLTDVYNSSITSTTSFPLTITAAPDVSLSSGASITMYPGTTTTATVNITPQNGFTGTVPLSCYVHSSPEGPGGYGEVYCLVASSVTVSDSNSVTATLTINPIPTATLGTYQIEVDATAVSPSETQSTSLLIPVTVQAKAGLSVANSGNISVAPGATSGNTSMITITPTAGFTGQVSLTCAVHSQLSTAEYIPTCSIPASVTISGATAVTAILTVNTTAPVSVIALVVVLGVTGCGGGGSSSGTGGTSGTGSIGTTPGTYYVDVTVTGTDGTLGTIMATTRITLSVT